MPSKWIEICRNGPLSAMEVAEKMASGHSVYSPSGSEMSMTCEESVYLNAIAPDDTTFEAAEGTVAHAMGEEWIKAGERPDHRLGEVFDIKGFEIEVDEDMLGFVGDFVKLCEEEAEGAELCESEKQVDTSHLTPIPDQGGTMDFVAIFPGYLTVVDLKYGKEKVDAFYFDEHGVRQINKQLAVYASGVFREWDWLYDFQHIKLVISQPRLPDSRSEVVISRGELLEFEEYAKDRWRQTWKPRDQLTRTPSVKGCRWCAARSNCSALYLFLTEATNVFSTFDDDGEIIEGQFEEITYDNKQLMLANETILDDMAPSPFPDLPDPRELTTRAMAKLLRYRKLMENFFNSIERELLDRAISNEEEIPWWKIVEGRANRKFVDDIEHIVEVVADQFGMTRDDLFKEVMLSPAQFETAVHTALNKGKAKGDKSRISLAKVQAMLAESDLTVRPSGQKTLAPSGDKRAELPRDGDVFADWSEDVEDVKL